MIKVITLITKFIIVALTALLFGSCNFVGNFESITGSGNVTVEKRSVDGDFKSVEVSNAIDLVIEQSENIEISVEADDNLQKEITTTIENGVLIISCKFNNFDSVTSKKVTVKMPLIEELEASSSSTITSKNKLQGDQITLSASSAAEIDLNLEFEKIESKASSAGNITIKGKALQLETNASSGSDIDAGNLLANEIIAKSSSGASITVHPIVLLKAGASSGGSINYNTIPKSIEKRESSGGNVSQE